MATTKKTTKPKKKGKQKLRRKARNKKDNLIKRFGISAILIAILFDVIYCYFLLQKQRTIENSALYNHLEEFLQKHASSSSSSSSSSVTTSTSKSTTRTQQQQRKDHQQLLVTNNNNIEEEENTTITVPIRNIGGNCWLTLNIMNDFNAIGDNVTDNTKAFHAAFQRIEENAASSVCKEKGGGGGAGGEVIVPKGYIFQTAPFNMTSNSILTVDGIIFGIPNQTVFPEIAALPSYGRDADFLGKNRRHPLVYAVGKNNITIRGHGIIDGAGWYWYPFFKDKDAAHHIGRPHLIELNNCTNIEITGITMKDSAFWTLHPIYCKNVYIHHTKFDSPSCRLYACPNTDGIDIDSSINVLVEYNEIHVGDDHVTVLAGKLQNKPNLYRSPPTYNVTVQHNILGRGMGLAIGSSTAGGISNVLYYNNTIRSEGAAQYGQGVHIKLRDRFGGYVHNVSWISNELYKVNRAIVFESGYQGNKQWKRCTNTTCPEVRDILIKDLIVHDGKPGAVNCYNARPCRNIRFENIHFDNINARISCSNVDSSSTYLDGTIYPNQFFEKCPNITNSVLELPTTTTKAT